MRRCLIGLSTPIGYNRAYTLEPGRPNPILEAPVGLFLLYDEIWFLHRNLCPYNMQGLKYVHFADQEHDLSFLDEPTLAKCADVVEATLAPVSGCWHSRTVSQHSSVVRNVRASGGCLKLTGDVTFRPSCMSSHNVMLDRVVADSLGLDLIVNSCFASAVADPPPALAHATLAQRLICGDFPNYQGVDGPYLPLIEDFRSDRAVKAFRKKLSSLVAPEPMELGPIMLALEKEMRKACERLLRDAASPIRIYKGICNAILGQIPIVSSILGALDSIHSLYKAYKEMQELEWMAFVSRSRDTIARNEPARARRARLAAEPRRESLGNVTAPTALTEALRSSCSAESNASKILGGYSVLKMATQLLSNASSAGQEAPFRKTLWSAAIRNGATEQKLRSRLAAIFSLRGRVVRGECTPTHKDACGYLKCVILLLNSVGYCVPLSSYEAAIPSKLRATPD